MIAVGAQANPEPSTRASHARVPTLTPEPDRPDAQTDRPYGLEGLQRQTRVAAVLRAGGTLELAATATGVGEPTLRWLERGRHGGGARLSR